MPDLDVLGTEIPDLDIEGFEIPEEEASQFPDKTGGSTKISWVGSGQCGGKKLMRFIS